MEKVKHYYYLHENGKVIHKPAIVVEMDPDYFDSPFVKKVWAVKTLEDLYRFILDLKKMRIDVPKGKIDL